MWWEKSGFHVFFYRIVEILFCFVVNLCKLVGFRWKFWLCVTSLKVFSEFVLLLMLFGTIFEWILCDMLLNVSLFTVLVPKNSLFSNIKNCMWILFGFLVKFDTKFFGFLKIFKKNVRKLLKEGYFEQTDFWS